MPVRTTGAEFREFFNDLSLWTKGTYMEDEEISVDGEGLDSDDSFDHIPYSAVVKIHAGIIRNDTTDKYGSLETEFRKWRKNKSTTTFVVVIDNQFADDAKNACRALGGKVVG